MGTANVDNDERPRRPGPMLATSLRDDRSGTPRFDTADLFGGTTEIEIVHQQVVYRLKITRQGKLILNK